MNKYKFKIIIMGKCIELNCNKQANFNIKTESNPIYCNQHKKDDMKNIRSKKCLENNCGKVASFNLIGEKNPLFCKQHSKEGMICLTTKKCIEQNCNISASFNFPGQKQGIYCKTHSKKDMLNVKSKKCLECNKIPNFNFINKKTGLYCFDHKKQDMHDVRHIKCLENDCKKRPTFNYINEKNPLYCFNHKKKDMIDVAHINSNCIKCKSVRAIPKYKNHCLRCFVNYFPNEKNSRNYKTKEKHIADFIKDKYPNFDILYDKIIDNACSKRRPDIFIDLGYHVLIIEVDENQHKSYDNYCEESRLNQIMLDLNCRKLKLIKFNPDKYREDNKIIPSCFKNEKISGCLVPDKERLNYRLLKLKEQIDIFLIERKDDDLLEIKYLFFNN